MIGKLLRLVTVLVSCLCVATLMAQVVIVGMLVSQGKLNAKSLEQIAAVLQGVDLTAQTPKADTDKDPADKEEPSYDDILQARAVKTRQIELREQALKSGMDELAARQRQIKAEMDAYQRVKTSFEASLAELDNAERVRARDEVRLILENMDPVQAKIQILRMVDADEMEDIVLMLSAMSPTKKAKIIAEFKSDEEQKTLEDILRLIKDGIPKTNLLDQTRQQLQPPGTVPATGTNPET
jgi:flagellar motor protein MotB